MKTYYGTKRIQACPEDRNGVAGYQVRYSDNYVSWSPAAAFEEAYRSSGRLNFGHALEVLKSGGRVARSGWNGKNMYLEMQRPDEHSKMTLPYIYMRTASGDLVPWLCSQTDALAEDWYVVGDQK